VYEPTRHNQPTDHDGAAALLDCIRSAAEFYRQVTRGDLETMPTQEDSAEAAVGLVVLLHDLVGRRPEFDNDLAELMLAAEVELEAVPLAIPADQVEVGDHIRFNDRWGEVASRRADHLGFVHIELDDGGPRIPVHHRQAIVIDRPVLPTV
jgi:hypothetical protein